MDKLEVSSRDTVRKLLGYENGNIEGIRHGIDWPDYLLEKYGPAFVTPIAESVLLIFNAIFSVCLLGEKMTSDMLIGLGFIILGIFFIYRKHLNII